MDEKAVAVLIKEVLEVELAYLFGSMAKKKSHSTKDADVGVYLNRELRGLEKLDYINHLSSQLQPLFKKPVDIVILNQASPALSQQVLKYGKLLFERKEGMATLFAVQTMTRYLDYLQILRFFTKRKLVGPHKEL